MNIWQPTKSFVLKCKRVWHTLKKPSAKEFKQVAKVSAIGVALLGAIGFLVAMFMNLFV
jgi:protein transport protein SEC61 subunit gamma and related proteins